jgi:hypothetical protein
MKVGKEVLSLVVSCIDIEKLVIGLIEGIGEEALREVVLKSPTLFDDMAFEMICKQFNPVMESLIKKKIESLKASLE